MKIKQTVKTLILGTLLIASTIGLGGLQVFAATNNGCETDTAIIKCSNVTGGSVQNTGLWSILLTGINILTAGVGIAAVGGVVYGAILYTSAGGAQEQVKKAREIITNVVIGVIAYALMFGALNFLIPGGIFNP